MKRAYEIQLFRACRVLFGPDLDIGWDFLFTVQSSGIKSAFRKRALLTHPDRAVRQGNGEGKKGAKLFVESRRARDHLLEFVHRRHTLHPPLKRAAGAKPAGRAKPAAHPGRRGEREKPSGYWYRGGLPRRRLMLGEFLFYSRAVSWEALIKAIVWQRSQRPRLGDIASDRGWISALQARRVALKKGLGVPMGEAMVRSGLLTSTQVGILLRRQRRMQKLLGEYFISQGLLSRSALEELVLRMGEHNRAHPGRGRFD